MLKERYTTEQLERAAREIARQLDMMGWDALSEWDRRNYRTYARLILDAAFAEK
jgi:hypothetical protein